MKPIKMSILAATAALMAMAFFSASAAIAEETALCKEDTALFSEQGGYITTDECPEANLVTHVHEASVGKVKMVASSGTIECDVLFLSTTGGVSALAAPQVIKGNFTYSNCTTGCTITEENGPAVLSALLEGHETASITFKYLIHLACSFLNCRYVGTGLKATVKGPLLSTEPNGEASLSEQSTTKESGTFCPTTTKLTIRTTPLAAVYISS